MKKALIFVLGAMTFAMMPSQGVKAQTQQLKIVEVHARTLDNAPLTEATLVAGAEGTTYYWDNAHFGGNATDAVAVDFEAQNTLSLTVSTDGYSILGLVDSLTYLNATIVAKDANGRLYAMGGATNSNERADGLFRTAKLTEVQDSILGTLTVADNMLMPYTIEAQNNEQIVFSTFAAAVAVSDTVSIVANDINIEANVVFDHPVVVLQNGKSIAININDAAATPIIIKSSVQWRGEGGSIASDANVATTMFTIEDGGALDIANVTVSSNYIARVADSSSLTIGSGSYTGTGHHIFANDSASIRIDGGTFEDGLYTVRMNDGFVGSVIVSNSANLNNSGVNGRAYQNLGAEKRYFTTLDQGSQQTTNGIIYLSRDLTGSENDTISSNVTLQLNSNTIAGRLFLRHTEGSVILSGGSVNILECDPEGTADITIDSIDVNSNLIIHHYNTTINNGRFNNIDLADVTTETLHINGGKFNGTPRTTLQTYLKQGRSFANNTDADASEYLYKVADGYMVTWNNMDLRDGGQDSITVEGGLVKTVVPGTSHIDGTGIDTIFVAWYSDADLTQSWYFPEYMVTSDTNLYAKYLIVDRDVTSEYVVLHVVNNIYGEQDTTAFTYYDTTGHSVVAYATIYSGYTVDKLTDTITNLGGNGNVDTVTFTYERQFVQVKWNAGEGYVDSLGEPYHELDENMVYRYGDSIDYTSHRATREGWTFLGWDTVSLIALHSGMVINANYEQNTYPTTWTFNGDAIDAADTVRVPYNGQAVEGLVATFTNDTNGIGTTNLIFVNGTDTTTSATNAGTYTVIANPDNTAYVLSGNRVVLVIEPGVFTIVSPAEIDTVKFYNGNDIANVANAGENSLGILYNSVSAHYDTPYQGTNKVIYVTYAIDNYVSVMDTIHGAILDSIKLDSNVGEEHNGFEVDATGYCTGNGTINFKPISGNIDQYKIDFEDAVFADVDWTNTSGTNSISIDVPDGTPAGIYAANVTFRNSNYPSVSSNPYTVHFQVNLPETYTMPLFSDVIALVDTVDANGNNLFGNVLWLHSTDGGTTWDTLWDAAGKYYYQDPSGALNGQYRAIVDYNGIRMLTCPQTDVTTLLADTQSPVTVSASPNPASERVVVRIDRSRAESHTLRVMNIMGIVVEQRTFSGDQTTIDLTGWQSGNYMVSVDGMAIRVIKR